MEENTVSINPKTQTKKKLDFHKVFAAIGIILIALIIIVGGVWYFVQSAMDKVIPDEFVTNKVSTSSARTKTATSSADWRTYTDSKNAFSIKYPDTWLTINCEGDFFISPTKEKLGVCASEFGGMVGVSYLDTDYTEYVSQEGFTDVSYLEGGTRTETTVAGMKAIKISGTYGVVEGSPYKSGAKRIFYIINDNGKVIFLNYYSESNWGDYSKEFELMVTTLKFL